MSGSPDRHSPEPNAAGDHPRVWLLLSDKHGDNGQVEVIAKALPWPSERKTVLMKPEWVFGKPKVAASLDHIDLERSDPLEPPWPDLILTIGRRPSMAALWVREQSGGKSRIALVGKPSSRLEDYDLVIVSAESQVPPLDNVLPIGLPLMEVDRDAIEAAQPEWSERLADLPHPLVAIFVGGPTGPFVFTGAAVDSVVEAANDVARQGGTAYLTTSRRTPPEVTETLRSRLPDASRLFAWGDAVADNPYHGLLAFADQFVVTGDSVSMQVEVARLGKPLQILPLPVGRIGFLDQLRRSAIRALFAPIGSGLGDRLRRLVMLAAYRSGLASQTRDFRAFHQMLFDRGLATPLGAEAAEPVAKIDDDLPRIIERLRRLLSAT